MGTNESYSVRATKTSFDVIEALREEDEAGVTALAERTDYSKSAVHKHLQTLVELGFVVKQGTSYRLGLEFLSVSHTVRGQRLDEFASAKREIDKLARSTGLLARLVVPERDDAVVLYEYSEKDGHASNYSSEDPQRLDQTPAGLAMLARMPDEYVLDLVERVTAEESSESVAVDGTDLPDRLQQIRDQGLAYVDSADEADTQTVAAPIIDGERPAGAVSVTGPIEQTAGLRLTEDVANLVVSTAESLAKE